MDLRGSVTAMVMAMAAAFTLSGTADAAAPNGRWLAVEIGGMPSARGVETTFELDGSGRVSGQGGCNAYGGPVTLGDGRIGFGPLMATKMACPGPEMDQESRYFQALGRASGWRLEGGRLVLVDARGKVVVAFVPLRRS